MKKTLLCFVAFVIATVCAAQTTLLATLSHEGTVTTYYGATALSQAHTAAVHGDVITLSSGNFIARNITKAVTIRGAGMCIDSTSVVEPTVITGEFTIDIPDSIPQRLTIEGIYSNNTIKCIHVKKPLFLKCRIKSVSYSQSSDKLKEGTFVQCRIADALRIGYGCSASCINSVIEDPETYFSVSGTLKAYIEFTNCVIVLDESTHLGYIKNSSFKNCCIYTSADTSIDNSCTAFNCVGVGNQIFKNITNSTNRIVSDVSALFKTYKGGDIGALDTETFHLTEAAQTAYLGLDGTQVGIYGGSMPFDPIPTNPQITKCKVAQKSTTDGKLSVDIEVKTAE